MTVVIYNPQSQHQKWCNDGAIYDCRGIV